MTRTLTPTEVSRQAESIRRDFAEAEPKVPSPLSPVALRPWTGRQKFEGRDSIGLADLTDDQRCSLILATDAPRWPLVIVGRDPNDAILIAAALACSWPSDVTVLDLADLAAVNVLPSAADDDGLLFVCGIPATDAPGEAEQDEQDRRERAAKSERMRKVIDACRAEGCSYDTIMRRIDEAEAEFQSNRPTPRDGGQNERTHRAKMLANLMTRRQTRGQATVIVSCGSVECDHAFARAWGIERATGFGSALTAIDADNVRVEVRRPKHLDV